MMKKIASYIKWLWKNAASIKLTLLLNIVLGVLSVAVNLAFIWVCKQLVDIAVAHEEGSGTLLVWGCCAMAALALIRIGINACNTRLENTTCAKLEFIIRGRLYTSLMSSPWKGRGSMHTGDSVNRLFTDVETIAKLICQDTPSMIITCFQVLAAFIFLCTMDWRLAMLLLLITPLFAVISKVFFRRMHKLTKDIRESESRVQSHIQESLQHKTLVQSFEVGSSMQGRLDSIQGTEMNQVVRRTNLNIFSRVIVSIAFNAGYIAAFIWGAAGIWHGAITFGIMTAFLQLVGQIQGPLMQLTRQIPQFIYAGASIDRLREIEDVETEASGEAVKVSGIPGISIEGLRFRYDDGDTDVLNGFSHEFAPGSKTAIVGETGVGKSTLIKLMLSLLKPSDGHICITSSNGEKVEVSSLTRSNLVYVPQGNSLFSGTIRENLLMGNADATEAELREALETAQAGFVLNLPDGLDTICGEAGTGLSEGQAQRIAIARALLRPGGILLLDEFSSSLDPETEKRLMENLTSSRAAGKTMIFITHREKISEYCDVILRME